jgi:hypothetical protein|tara:strand:+ start:2598 stop:2879 length:282 start_codon:yes stop_codon:yes gene_type:complete
MIHILSPESFAQYKSDIGLIELYDTDQSTVDLYTGHKHLVIDRDELSIPSIEAIKKELNSNAELKHLAHEHSIIEIHNQDTVGSYLSYVSTYN